MANPIPKPPLKAQVLDENGFMTPLWAAWIRELFVRVGGSVAPSVTEFADELESLDERVDTLESNSASQSTVSNLSTLVDGLLQGTDL